MSGTPSAVGAPLGREQPPGRVLVRLPNWVGDIVMATPALAALRRHWPEAHLVAAGPAHAVPLLAGSALVDDVLTLPPRRGTGLAGLARAVRLMAAGRHELAILFTNSISSALVAALARVPLRVGHAGSGRTPLLTHAVPRGRERGFHHAPQPMVEAYFRLLEHVGVPRGDPHYVLTVTPEDAREAQAWKLAVGVPPDARCIGIHPGSSFGPSKLWITERFAAVADALQQRLGATVLVFCGPGEEPLAHHIAASARLPVITAADVPLSLGGLKAVVRELDLLVTTDTGPRHFGPAFDVPTVVVMGSTDPRFTNTNLGRTLVVRSGVACSPCQLKVCPIDHRCMTRLQPEHVLAAVTRLLSAPG